MANHKKSQEQLEAQGTAQKCRQRVNLFPHLTDEFEEPTMPQWLSQEAQEIFREKVERYRARNQRVKGFEDALGHYSALEARLRAEGPQEKLLREYRAFAALFFDTPSSRIATTASVNRANPFSRNIRR